jgi:SIT4 phosphatase-associated protein
MSFWKTFGFQTVSAIDTLMEGEFTLEQLLDEEELLQETKSQHKQLLDYLCTEETLRRLLELATVPAKKKSGDTGSNSGEKEEKKRKGGASPAAGSGDEGEGGAPEKKGGDAADKAAEAAADKDSEQEKGGDKDEKSPAEEGEGEKEKGDGDGDESTDAVDAEEVASGGGDDDDNAQDDAGDDADDADEHDIDPRTMKHPYIAQEILTADVWSICDAVFQHEDLLKYVFRFLEYSAEELEEERRGVPYSVLVMYSARIAGSFLSKKGAETIAVLQKNNTVAQFLEHLSNSHVMELLLKLISTDDSDAEFSDAGAPTVRVLEWLREGDLIPELVKKFAPSRSHSREENAASAENAAQALVDIVVVSSVSESLNSVSASSIVRSDSPLSESEQEDNTSRGPSPLVQQLRSDAVSSELFAHITAANANANHIGNATATATTSSGNPALLHGLSVVIEVLKGHVSDSHSDLALDDKDFPPFIRRAVESLPTFCAYLSTSSSSSSITLALGERRAPLGFHRLKLIELFAVMARLNFAAVEDALVASGAFSATFKLCFAYRWNNFLHALVDAIVEAAMAGPSVEFKLAILRPRKEEKEEEKDGKEDGNAPGCGLLDQICGASDANDEIVASGGARLGFMGFVTCMADAISGACALDERVSALVSGHEKYRAFETGPLKQTRERDSIALAGYSRGDVGGGFSFGDFTAASSSVYSFAAANSGSSESNDENGDDDDEENGPETNGEDGDADDDDGDLEADDDDDGDDDDGDDGDGDDGDDDDDGNGGGDSGPPAEDSSSAAARKDEEGSSSSSQGKKKKGKKAKKAPESDIVVEELEGDSPRESEDE